MYKLNQLAKFFKFINLDIKNIRNIFDQNLVKTKQTTNFTPEARVYQIGCKCLHW